jgi:hypothetical protein
MEHEDDRIPGVASQLNACAAGERLPRLLPRRW